MNNQQHFTVSINPQVIVYGILIAALAWFVYSIQGLVILFISSYIIFSALNPLVNKIQRITIGKNKWKLPRALAIAVVFLTFIAVFSLLIWAIIGPTATELSQLAGQIDEIQDRIIAQYGLTQFQESGELNEVWNRGVEQIENFLNNIAGNPGQVVSFGRDIFGGFLSVVTLLALVFYQLSSPEKVKNFISSFFPNQTRAQELIHQSELKLGSWLQGQITLMILMGVASYILFRSVGIPFAFPLALIVGLFDIVAVIGPIIAFLPVLTVSLAFGEPWQIFTIAAFYLILQQLEGNFLVPKIMESSVGLDPIIVLLALSAGSAILGIPGAILSVPVAAIGMILYQDWMESKRKQKKVVKKA
jgi:predicted PurR-regulated permease PerM